MKNRWLDRLALRSLFDPELRLPKHTVERVLRLLGDQEREYRTKLRQRSWIIAVLGVLLLAAIGFVILFALVQP